MVSKDEKEKLADEYWPTVEKRCKQYYRSRPYLDYDSVLSAGGLALATAVKQYHPGRGRFSSLLNRILSQSLKYADHAWYQVEPYYKHETPIATIGGDAVKHTANTMPPVGESLENEELATRAMGLLNDREREVVADHIYGGLNFYEMADRNEYLDDRGGRRKYGYCQLSHIFNAAMDKIRSEFLRMGLVNDDKQLKRMTNDVERKETLEG